MRKLLIYTFNIPRFTASLNLTQNHGRKEMSVFLSSDLLNLPSLEVVE